DHGGRTVRHLSRAHLHRYRNRPRMRRQFSARDCGGAGLTGNVLTRTQTQDARRFPAAILRAFLVDALRACGLSEADTSTGANAMLEADLTGSDAHGIFRLAGYVRQLKRGAI